VSHLEECQKIQLGHACSNPSYLSAGVYELHDLRMRKKTNRSIDASKMLKSRNQSWATMDKDGHYPTCAMSELESHQLARHREHISKASISIHNIPVEQISAWNTEKIASQHSVCGHGLRAQIDRLHGPSTSTQPHVTGMAGPSSSTCLAHTLYTIAVY
jgi:hypothetical protein